MEYTSVDSEAISGLRYDDRHGVLDVKFTTGSIYWYFDVARWEFEELLAAESVGGWFNTVFKARRHRYAEIYRPSDPPRRPPSPPHRPELH
jgi:hypothetical protein